MTMRMQDVNRSELTRQYQLDGFVVLPGLLADDLLAELRAGLPAIMNEPGPQRFLEADGTTVRAVYGLHRKAGPWQRASERSPIPEIAELLLGTSAYVYQWKVNPKAAQAGEQWEWHRDHSFWRQDGMPAPDAVTAAILLDDVTETNGPLMMIAGSHLTARLPGEATQPGADLDRLAADDWAATVSSSLAFSVPEETAMALAGERGPISMVGPAGTVIFFHSNIVHGSAPNRSQDPRTLALITYNAIRNAPPADWPSKRPAFFYNQDPVPLSLRGAAVTPEAPDHSPRPR